MSGGDDAPRRRNMRLGVDGREWLACSCAGAGECGCSYGAMLASCCRTLTAGDYAMSERNKPHNGRDLDGQSKVRRTDVDDLAIDGDGSGFLRDDVRLGGAVADTGPHAGEHGAKVRELIADNRANVERLVHPERDAANH
jgi:hypothetical protein